MGIREYEATSMTPDSTDADPEVITDAELDEWEQGIDQGQGLELRTADFLDLIKALRACRQRSRAAIEVLQDWENTPGNHRDAAWWHEWERKRRAALDKEVGDANR